MRKPIIHVSDAEATSDFGAVLARVRAGAEVVIEHDSTPVAVVQPALVRRTIAECIALLSEESTAKVDPDFGKDVEAAVASHPEPLTPSEWD